MEDKNNSIVDKDNLKELSEDPIKKEVFQAIQMQQFSGPLPHPSILKEYQELIPNAPERFFKLVENENNHRHLIETKAIDGKISYDKRGQWMAFTLAISIISIGAISIFQGYTIPGSIMLGISAVGLAGVFIKGKNPVSKENNKK